MMPFVRAAVVFPAFLLLLAMVTPAGAKGPALSVDQAEFDFGEVLQGESLEHVFTFQNTGDENLVISKVRSSCGCTAALLSADVLSPGARGEVRATFNAGNFRGQVEKSIYLTSNDPRQVSAVLRLRGRVLPLLTVPDSVDLGSFAPGEWREVRIPLVNRSKNPIVLTSVESTLPAVHVIKGATTLPAGRSGEILVRAEVAAGEPLHGYLLIRTNHPRMAQMRIPLTSSSGPR